MLSKPSNTVSVESVLTRLKGLQNELSSALFEARRAHMTEPQTCGQTKSIGISKDTLEAIEVSALLLVQSMKMIAGSEAIVEPTPKTQTKSEAEGGIGEAINCWADGNCPICLRIAYHGPSGSHCPDE